MLLAGWSLLSFHCLLNYCPVFVSCSNSHVVVAFMSGESVCVNMLASACLTNDIKLIIKQLNCTLLVHSYPLL